MEQPKAEICIIKIMFPVKSEEQAIDCKKKITAVLSDIPDSHIDFRLTSMPINPARPSI